MTAFVKLWRDHRKHLVKYGKNFDIYSSCAGTSRCDIITPERQNRRRLTLTAVWGKTSDLTGALTSWEAHHKTAVASGGADTLSNCEILCIACHKNARTYGR